MLNNKTLLSTALSEATTYIKDFDAKCRETAELRLKENALYKPPTVKAFLWVIFELAATTCLLYFKAEVYQIIAYKMVIGVPKTFFNVVLLAGCILILLNALISLGRMLMSVVSARKVSHIRKMGQNLINEIGDADAFTKTLQEAIRNKEDMVIDTARPWEDTLEEYRNEAVAADAGSARIKKIALTALWLIVLIASLVFFFENITENLSYAVSYVRCNAVMLSYILLFFVFFEVVVHLAPYYGKKVKPILMIIFALFQCGVVYRLYQMELFKPLLAAYELYLTDGAIPEKLQIPYAILRGIVADYLFLVLFFTTVFILTLLKRMDVQILPIRIKEGVDIPMQNGPDIQKTGPQVRWMLVSRCAIAVLLAQYSAKFASDAFCDTSSAAPITVTQTVILLGVFIAWRIMCSVLNSDKMKAVLGGVAPCLKYALLTVYALLTLSISPFPEIWPYAVLTVQYLFML